MKDKRALFEYIRVDNSGVERELKRIADAFEAFLQQSFGYVTHPTPLTVDDKGDEVAYTDDVKTLAQDLRDLQRTFAETEDEQEAREGTKGHDTGE